MPLLLFKRMERMYPVTFVCVAMAGLIGWISQGIIFPLRSYVETGLVSMTFTGTERTLGVSWYLMVLMFVYLICTLVPRISLTNLTYVYGFLYALVVLPAALADYPQWQIFGNLEYVAKFCGIPLMGTAAALLEKETSLFRKVVDMAWFFILTLGLLRLDSLLYGTVHSYTNIWTYVAALIIIAISILAAHFIKNGSVIKKWLRRIDKYLFHFYLLHLGAGFTTIYWMRMNGIGVNACVVAAYVISVIAAVAGFYLSKALVFALRKIFDGIANIKINVRA